MWKECACRSHFCATKVVQGAECLITLMASPDSLSFAGSLNLQGLTEVLSFSFAQHLKNTSMQINTLTVNLTAKGGGGLHFCQILSIESNQTSTVNKCVFPLLSTLHWSVLCRCILSGQNRRLKLAPHMPKRPTAQCHNSFLSPNPCCLATEYQTLLIHIDK